MICAEEDHSANLSRTRLIRAADIDVKQAKSAKMKKTPSWGHFYCDNIHSGVV